MKNKGLNNNLLNNKPGRHFLPRFLYDFFFKHWKVSITLTVLLVILMIPFIPMLTLMDGKTKHTVLQFPIEINEGFSIQYIHSIHRTPVEEYFYIDNDYNIVAEKTIFESYGVGIPSNIEEGQVFYQENGKFVIDHIQRVLPYFDQRIGQVIANHQLRIKGIEIPLNKVTTPGNWVRFKVTNRSILQYLKGGSWNE